MTTGGVEDGSYMCLVFDAIETVPEASACVKVQLSLLHPSLDCTLFSTPSKRARNCGIR